MVREEHRLGRLHVRVAGHHDAKLLLGAVEQHLLDPFERSEQLVSKVASDHMRVDGGLVIAGAAGAGKAATSGPDALGEHALDGHVDVPRHGQRRT